jgi:hypothetical protein
LIAGNVAYREIYPLVWRARARERVCAASEWTGRALLPDSLRVFFVRELSATRRVGVAVCSVKTSDGIDAPRRSSSCRGDVFWTSSRICAARLRVRTVGTLENTARRLSASRRGDSNFGDDDFYRGSTLNAEVMKFSGK